MSFTPSAVSNKLMKYAQSTVDLKWQKSKTQTSLQAKKFTWLFLNSRRHRKGVQIYGETIFFYPSRPINAPLLKNHAQWFIQFFVQVSKVVKSDS